MKKINLIIFSLFSTLMLSSCVFERNEDDVYVDNYYPSQYEPVILNRTALETSIKFKPVQPMVAAGKIYVKDHYIFIVDKNKGVHIYNNQNPQSPVEISFLEIPGVTDIAIRNNNFYVNQATDLVAMTIDVSSQNVNVTKRIKNTFPKKVSPDGYTQNVGDDQVVVDWIKRN